jgi:hypothetical protein
MALRPHFMQPRQLQFRASERSLTHLGSGLSLSATLLLAALSPLALAQTAPAQPVSPPPAPAEKVPAKSTGTLNVSPSAASALAIEVSGAVKGRLVPCPKSMKFAASAVCLYTQNTLPNLRSVLRAKLTGRTLSDWKTAVSGKSSSLIARAGAQNAFVLLTQLSATETLVVVDAVPTAAAPAGRPATPTGVVKGQPYVLNSDLAGLVNVVGTGSGSYRLASVAGGPVLTAVVGQKSAKLGTGTIELPLAPATDGKNLLFPLDGLRSLGCTLTPAQVGFTVSCGSASANIRPIVF